VWSCSNHRRKCLVGYYQQYWLSILKKIDPWYREDIVATSLAIQKPYISDCTGFEVTVGEARSWLSTCVTEHACDGVLPSRLPTRVLCIDDPNAIRLLVSTDEVASHACLSHCWGPQPDLVLGTTQATVQGFGTRMPWNRPPNTSRDAIRFTYHLGIRNLWIERFCIIQDSIEGWRREGSLTASMYSSACVTLQTAKATNPEDGCFSTP
jgi:hypothetical protein